MHLCPRTVIFDQAGHRGTKQWQVAQCLGGDSELRCSPKLGDQSKQPEMATGQVMADCFVLNPEESLEGKELKGSCV